MDPNLYSCGKNIFKKRLFLDLFKIFLTLSKEQNKVWCKCKGELVGIFNNFMNGKGHIGIRPMSTNIPRLLVLLKNPVTLKLLHWRLKDSNTFSIIVASIKRNPNFQVYFYRVLVVFRMAYLAIGFWHDGIFFLEFFHRQNRLIKTIKEFDVQKLLTAVIDIILVC